MAKGKLIVVEGLDGREGHHRQRDDAHGDEVRLVVQGITKATDGHIHRGAEGTEQQPKTSG